MLTVLVYLVVVVIVAALVFLLASLVFGRGEELAPLPPGATPTQLPEVGITPDDVRALRFQQVLRGYKMAEVDWALERLAFELDHAQHRVAELEAERAHRAPAEPEQRTAELEPHREQPTRAEPAARSHSPADPPPAGPWERKPRHRA